MIKRIILTVVLIFCAMPLWASVLQYQKIYDELAPCDFSYMFGIDPYQNEDYIKFRLSPYPLLRTGVEFRFKDTVIPRGYYLLTPREKNGKDYVLFKQNGKVAYIIPVYKKELVDPTFYDRYIPKQKISHWRKFVDFCNRVVGRVSADSKRLEPPKAYIDVNDIGDNFWEVVLYYGANKYRLLFLKD